jgi:alkylhydroperoxidase/carboxymuconolactone decarboxylase family protein YurZ
MTVQRTNTMEVFQREASDVANAFHGLIEAIQRLDGLDQKTKQLLYTGIRASEGDVTTVVSHVPMAKLCGATRAEVRDTTLMTLVVSGIKGVAHCLPMALDAYDHTGSEQ